MRLLKQSSTAQPLMFLMVDSTDHVTGKTGLTPTVTLSKNGGAFASPSGAVTEVANGWYKVAGNATDTNTLGPLILHATGTAADPVDVYFDVVAVDPQSSTAFITGVNSLAPPTNFNLLSIDSDGRVDVGAIRGSATAAVGLSAMGQYYDTETTLNVFVEGITAGVVTTIQTGLSTLTAQQVWEYGSRALTDKAGFTISGTITTLDALDTALDSAHGANSWATATGFSTHSASDVWAVATRTLTANTNLNILTAADIRTAVGLASANLDTQLSAIVTDTNELQLDWVNGGRLDLILDASAASASTAATNAINANTNTNTIITNLATVDGIVDDIKAVTVKMDTMLVLDGVVYQFTANALELGPTGEPATGNGDIAVDHDYGGTDELQILEISTDDPMDDALITAFAGGVVNGQTRTGSDGRWIAPLMLDAGSYTLVISKQGQQTQSVALTVVEA